MKVKVEACWSGNENYSYRFTMPTGERFFIGGDEWTRSIATQAKDYVSNNYSVNRNNIKFDHY